MASSSKLQLGRFYERLSLPTLSFLLLTGFSFSITLPSALQVLIPAMESLLLVSVPHFWKAFLSWITPPCLFVLLNGIIMILTATSGSFSSPASSSSGGSDLCANSAKQSAVLEPVPAILDDPASLDELQAVDDTPPGIDSPVPDMQVEGQGPTVSQLGNIGIPSTQICLDADAVEELPNESDSNGGAGSEGMEMAIICEEVSELRTEIIDAHEIDSDDPSSSFCEEIVKGGSAPSSPHFPSSPALKNNVRRSFSIDSAELVDNEALASEYLSDDAFKKRIEDFIFKVNSKIRSETRLL